MKIINLVKSEFIKHYSIKRFIIIFIVLLVSSLFLVKFSNNLLGERSDIEMLQSSIDSFERSLDRSNKKANKTFTDYYNIHYYINYIKYMSLLKDIEPEYKSDWKSMAIVHELLPVIMQNYLIEKMKDNPNDPYIINVCNNEDNSDDGHRTQEQLKYLCDNYELNELDELYNKNLLVINDYENLIKENKYYLYLEYQVKNNIIDENEFVKILIEKKVESSNSYLGLNYLQYKALEQNSNIEIMSQEEFEKGDYKSFNSYKEYVSYNTKLKNDAINNRKILLYSSENEIKHDIEYHYYDGVNDSDRYMNTKLKVNQVFHLSVVVIIIIAITGGGIISNEHSKGTIKNIITTPVRRWKILVSKFIYLILDAYIVWFLGLLIISVLSGIEFGFSDLFDPKLVVFNGSVIEVNYFLYIIKDIFIASIPVICFISILFFLSTVFLNTSLTVGITSVLGIVSPFIWLLSIVGNFRHIVYTPLWYFDLGFMFNNSEHYVESLRKISYDLSTGIIISVVVTLILYTISNVVYIKRDIKN
ncbi:MAG: hypothetical protein E7168_01140 [Firmicutes bacterium]|nr:hypothetical protein [Bacillota bacterium]